MSGTRAEPTRAQPPGAPPAGWPDGAPGAGRRATELPIEDVRVVGSYSIPTDAPEADGTLAWDSTSLVVVEATAGGERGIGFTYADRSVATLVQSVLADVVRGRDALAIPGAWDAMRRATRQMGRSGIAAMAISAVDVALWDLKGRLLGRAVADLLGRARAAVPIYGSGGFTTYSEAQLRAQLGGWVQQGIPRVKMKIGSDPAADPERVHWARAEIGPGAELYVDANGAYSRKQALVQAERFAEQGVSWLEEPVSSDDLDGLRLIRDRAPAGMAIAAGEYGFHLGYFRTMLEAGAVDVLQADVTRAGGISGFLAVGALAQAFELPLSAHCAPALSAHACCVPQSLVHLEYFHDHVRIESMLFDGVIAPREGALCPDASRPGLGLEFKRADAERYRT